MIHFAAIVVLCSTSPSTHSLWLQRMLTLARTFCVCWVSLLKYAFWMLFRLLGMSHPNCNASVNWLNGVVAKTNCYWLIDLTLNTYKHGQLSKLVQLCTCMAILPWIAAHVRSYTWQRSSAHAQICRPGQLRTCGAIQD